MEQSENPLIKTFITLAAALAVLVILFLIWKKVFA